MYVCMMTIKNVVFFSFLGRMIKFSAGQYNNTILLYTVNINAPLIGGFVYSPNTCNHQGIAFYCEGKTMEAEMSKVYIALEGQS